MTWRWAATAFVLAGALIVAGCAETAVPLADYAAGGPGGDPRASPTADRAGRFTR